jgi:hypothetical protein
VKASNFTPHGNFAHFLARSIAHLGEFGTRYGWMDGTKFADLDFFLNFHSLKLFKDIF